MDRVEVVPTWKKALAFAGYSMLTLFIGFIVMTVIAINLEDSIPEGSLAVFSLIAVSLLIALPVTLWWRYQLVNKNRFIAERKAREAQMQWQKKELETRRKSGGPIETIVKVIFYISLGLASLYIAFQLIAWLPVSVAVILGAVLIGLCIVVAARR